MTNTTTATDEALRTAAVKGDQPAFAELHQRHAPVAWRLALAVAGDPDLAADAVSRGTGTVFTALRAGRFPAHGYGTALAAATRNAALDLRVGVVTTSRSIAEDADAQLAAAFAALPERWRSVLWLRDAEGHEADGIAPVVELSPEAVDQLAVRARRGLRERYVRSEVATAGPRVCTRAVARLGALEDGTLSPQDVATLERHLRTCVKCADRRERVAGLTGALPALALPMPADLRDRAGKAWTAALATPTHTGLPARTEKLLAGATAVTAALGIISAAFLGNGDDAEPTASPLAPLVADIDAPRPVDLSDLIAPLTSPAPVTTARSTFSAIDSATPVAPAPSAGGEVAAPATPTDPGTTDPGTPAGEGPTGPVPGLPVDVDPVEGITVGPVRIDPSPDGGPVLEIDAPAELQPVVGPVTEAVNQVAVPVAEALEPVSTPVLEATQPVTDAIGAVGVRLGL